MSHFADDETLAHIAALELEVMNLRSVMADVIKAHGYEGGTPVEVMSTPFTPTALNELIEKVERRTIERCAKEAFKLPEDIDEYESPIVAANKAIRALPVGHIKLEELL